jgi:hypothetical protein
MGNGIVNKNFAGSLANQKSAGKGVVNTSLAEKVAGRQSPHKFPVLDASVLDQEEAHRIIREDVKMNKVVYEFPAGFNKISLFEECRALTLLEDFQTMYDITMQLLVNKDVIIKLRGEDDEPRLLCQFHVTDRFQDLRGVDKIDEYPVLVTWLTEFIAADLLKKYPLPGKEAPQPATASKKRQMRGGKDSSIKQE